MSSSTVFYRRINLKNDDELSFIAKIDVTIPAQYDSDFLVNDETVQKQFQNLKDKFSEDDFFDVAEDNNKNIIGYHAVKRISVFEKKAGSIYTLWVSPIHRNQGIATELKKRAENWAKENKLDHIFTWVHSDNSKMILLNKALGYEIVNFKMKKTIPTFCDSNHMVSFPSFPLFCFNDQLKEVPKDVQEYESYIEDLKKNLLDSNIPKDQVKIFENLGVALRILNRLDESETYLAKALSLSSTESTSKQVQNLIRLAHVYQWQRQFLKAKTLFDQARALINEFSISDTLRAAYHQHLGKFYFDQKLYGLALIEFELTKRIRIQISAPQDQLESTEFSIVKAKENWSIKIAEDFVIRRAEINDAESIHNAHMLSINEICSKDHTPDEIRVWGGRTFEQVNRIPYIQNYFYLVVEFEGKIEGFCQAKSCYIGSKDQVHLHGFYITPKILKQGIGHILMNLVLEYARSENVPLLTLKSTITSFEFYKKYGFIKTGELTGPIRDGVMIRGYPMEKTL